jgi:cell division GTPase FtsZ
VNILLMSSGGGGGNILRSLKTLFRRDLIVTQKSDPKYAERLRRAVSTRFLDTNEFSLADVPREERLLIGETTTRRLGSMHNPDVARAALEESRRDVESLLSRFSVIVLIATGGKGTGAGTIFPLAQMARKQRKLVIPIFVRPSFERHEVEKQRYDHAVRMTEQFDGARIRFIEILNDRGYADDDPQPQSMVWERMNRPIARGLRGLLYVLSDLSQVDPSDLSVMFAGHGRLRIGFSEINPSAGKEPSDQDVEHAVRGCWDNPYYTFGDRVGTSLICIEGDWSNVVDGKIKGRLAAFALQGGANPPYNPLYARAVHVPRPWGVTALFADHTGSHPPLEIDWKLERRAIPLATSSTGIAAFAASADAVPKEVVGSIPIVEGHLADTSAPMREEIREEALRDLAEERPPVMPEMRPEETTEVTCAFGSFSDFARALNRSDPAALALARNGAQGAMPLDGDEIRKLLRTYWFRSVFPHLSSQWRDRILDALLDSVTLPNYPIRSGRRTVLVSELQFDELRRFVTEAVFPDAVRTDLQLLIAVGTLWGPDTLKRFTFTELPKLQHDSRFASLLQPFRHGV